jgi:hypothetical protein
MTASLVSALLRAVLACALIAGCAAGGTSPTTAGAAMSAAGTIAARDTEAIAVGTSTKFAVRAALGTAMVVSFDSGFEVWVYRLKGSAATQSKNKFAGWFAAKQTDGAAVPAGEFVVLFAPSGVVSKTRLRQVGG